MGVATSTESRANERTVYVEDGIMNHLSLLSPDHKQLLMNAMDMEVLTLWGQCRVAPFDGSAKGKRVGPTGCARAAWSPDGESRPRRAATRELVAGREVFLHKPGGRAGGLLHPAAARAGCSTASAERDSFA
jgi:hypothetical protein